MKKIPARSIRAGKAILEMTLSVFFAAFGHSLVIRKPSRIGTNISTMF